MKNRKHYTVITIQNIRLHLNGWYIFFIMLCIRKRETVSYLQYVYDLDFVYHTYNMFMSQISCIRKRDIVSYLQYVYVLDFVHQKEGNCIISTVCLCSRLCVSDRGKLYHTCNMFMFQIFCIRKRETVSYLQYVYVIVILPIHDNVSTVPTLQRFNFIVSGNTI